jgi:hypothetical protein
MQKNLKKMHGIAKLSSAEFSRYQHYLSTDKLPLTGPYKPVVNLGY